MGLLYEQNACCRMHSAPRVSQIENNANDSSEECLFSLDPSVCMPTKCMMTHDVPSLQLSDEVKLLLDKIFKVNEKERIGLEGIMEDPWYREPLQPKYAQAEARISQQQEEVEEQCRQRALNPVSALPRHNHRTSDRLGAPRSLFEVDTVSLSCFQINSEA